MLSSADPVSNQDNSRKRRIQDPPTMRKRTRAPLRPNRLDVPAEIRTILSKDSVTEFRDYIDKNGCPDGLLMAAAMNSTDIALWCLQNTNTVNVYAQTSDRNNAFTYAGYHSNVRLCRAMLDSNLFTKSFLLMKNKQGYDGLMYAAGPDMNAIKLHMVFSGELPTRMDPGFRVFDESEFDRIDYDEDPYGSYGRILEYVHRETKEIVAVKEYTTEENAVMDESIAKEIKFLMKVGDSVAPRLYGVIIKNGIVNPVMERFRYSLVEVSYMFQWLDDENKHKFYKFIYGSVLDCIHWVNRIGINHNDVKSNNIMLDDAGNFRLVDFGIADDFGLYPSTSLTNSVKTTRHIRSADLNTVHLMQKTVIKYTGSFRTLNTDVHALGTIMANLVMGSITDAFVCHEGILYSSQKSNYREFYPCESWMKGVTKNRTLILDLIKVSVESNSSKRHYAPECLKHEYFTGVPYCRPRARPFKRQSLGIPNRNDYEHAKDRELFYAEDANVYLWNVKFSEFYDNAEDVYECIHYLVLELKNGFMSPNVFVNTVNAMKSLLNSGMTCSYESTVAVRVMNAHTFEPNSPELGEYSTENTSAEDLTRAALSVVRAGNPFSDVPLNSIVGLITVVLQEYNVEPAKMIEIEDRIMYSLCVWVVFHRGVEIPVLSVARAVYALSSQRQGLPRLPTPVDENTIAIVNRTMNIQWEYGIQSLIMGELRSVFGK
jgi:serine/threonine protein kinase